MGHEEKVPLSLDQQREALQDACRAAVAGDPKGMVEALFRGHVLDGFARQIRGKFQALTTDAADTVLAESVDALYVQVKSGKSVTGTNFPGLLWRIAERRAADYCRGQVREVRGEEIERMAERGCGGITYIEGSEYANDQLDDAESEESWRKGISVVRGLVPRLGHETAQQVMGYILDALEAKEVFVANEEVAEALSLSVSTVRQSRYRAFQRLARIALAEGLIDTDTIRSLGRYGDLVEEE